MDIDRPDLKQQHNRRRWLTGIAIVVLLTMVTLGLSRLKPAAPRVESAQIWHGTVQRGEMVREVRGNGSLVPEKIITIQSDTGGTVEDILVWPGTVVETDTVIMILKNPQLKQETFDMEWQLKAAEAQQAELIAQLETEKFSQEATVTTREYELRQARLEASASEKLFDDNLIAELTAKAQRAKSDGLEIQFELEKKRLQLLERTSKARMAVQEADIEKLKASLELKKDQVRALHVTAGISGVLQQIGEGNGLELGARVTAGATLAKVVRPDQLKAEIKIPETQAKDVRIGQTALIDMRNGKIKGIVSRVDPAVLNGTVTVDVSLEGELPLGARPDLSVDGTIELERLSQVLHVGRPVHGQSESTISLYKILDTKEAVRVTVKLGRSSVSTVEIIEGLEEGDQVILSDMSQWDEYDRVQLK